MAALLHDGRALAVVLTDDDQGAAGHAARGEVGQRVGGDVGADRRLERDCAAQRVIHRGSQRGRRRRLAGAVLEADALLDQDVLRVGQHVHQVRDRRPLVARDIGDLRLEQRFRHRQDALSAEDLPGAEPEFPDFLDKGSFSHACSSTRRCAGPPSGSTRILAVAGSWAVRSQSGRIDPGICPIVRELRRASVVLSRHRDRNERPPSRDRWSACNHRGHTFPSMCPAVHTPLPNNVTLCHEKGTGCAQGWPMRPRAPPCAPVVPEFHEPPE